MLYKFYEKEEIELSLGTFELIEFEKDILFSRRKELKLTQQQVADKADIQLRQYQRFEKGERTLSGSSGRIMLSVCEALKLDPYIFIAKGNEKPEIKYVVLPPIEVEGMRYTIPSLAFYTIVSAIPRGMVCSDDDIMNCLRKAYGMNSLEIKTDMNSTAMYGYDAFPFWRVVSQKGYLINSIYCSKERQKELLETEGVKTNQVNDNDSYRIDEYEFRKFNVNNFKISVLKSDKQLMEEFKSLHEKE